MRGPRALRAKREKKGGRTVRAPLSPLQATRGVTAPEPGSGQLVLVQPFFDRASLRPDRESEGRRCWSAKKPKVI